MTVGDEHNRFRILLLAKPGVSIRWVDVHFSVAPAPNTLSNHRLQRSHADARVFEYCCVPLDITTQRLSYFFTFEVNGVVTDTRIFTFLHGFIFVEFFQLVQVVVTVEHEA